MSLTEKATSDTLDGFRQAIAGEHAREAAGAVTAALVAVQRANAVRADDAVRERYWTISGAGDLLGVGPEDVRRAVAGAGVVYAMAINDEAFLDEAGVVRVGRWLADQVRARGRG